MGKQLDTCGRSLRKVGMIVGLMVSESYTNCRTLNAFLRTPESSVQSTNFPLSLFKYLKNHNWDHTGKQKDRLYPNSWNVLSLSSLQLVNSEIYQPVRCLLKQNDTFRRQLLVFPVFVYQVDCVNLEISPAALFWLALVSSVCMLRAGIVYLWDLMK